MLKNKLIATVIHFLFSLLIFSIFIISLRTLWYPEPYFTASGGWQGLKLVAFIDLILGPLLTFVVFNHQKSTKELRADLSIILLIQLSALAWGIYTVYHQRPIAITFWEHSFYSIPANAISKEYSDSKQFNALKDNARQLYIVPKPTDVKNIKQLSNDVQAKQLPPFQLIERYEPIKNHFKNIRNHSIDINEVINKNEQMNNALSKLLKNSNSKINNNFYIPLISRYQNIILVFSNNNELLGYLKAPLKGK